MFSMFDKNSLWQPQLPFFEGFLLLFAEVFQTDSKNYSDLKYRQL